MEHNIDLPGKDEHLRELRGAFRSPVQVSEEGRFSSSPSGSRQSNDRGQQL